MRNQYKLPLRVINVDSLCWRPRPDINAHELAQALPVLLLTDQRIKGQLFSELPPHVSRHFNYQTSEYEE